VIERLVAGLIVSVLVAALGRQFRSLTTTGMLAAVAVGTAIAIGTSWAGLVILGTFFVLSSLLSRLREREIRSVKGSQRDAVQVLANGGVAAVAAVTVGFADERLALVIVGGSLAAAAADTWATEIGATSSASPRLILSRRTVLPGESGGVTLRGTLAAFAGSLVIAVVAGLVVTAWLGAGQVLAMSAIILLAGMTGTTVDSLAGELVQERRICARCDEITEARTHSCGTVTLHHSGIGGITNDFVNLMCTLAGGVVAALVVFF
jgi:uncharacterized protein (TIGR00297 family)